MLTSRIAALLGIVFLMTAATTGKPRLTFSGLGDIRIGMTMQQLANIGFKADQKPEWQEQEEFFACHYVANKADYPGINLMINDGKLARIEMTSAQWQTLSGARVGMSIASVKKIYGDWLIIKPHPYGDDEVTDWAYLTLTSADKNAAAIFEVAGGKVEMIRAGRAGPVGYIEGCS